MYEDIYIYIIFEILRIWLAYQIMVLKQVSTSLVLTKKYKRLMNGSIHEEMK